ncbi:PAS domain-containing protein [Parvibaculum sp.]|uniref:PAS domain-containing protein n=2 Tax=Parvibaculum sp. TaxID=2024848 RepID=UPI0032EB4824
MLDELTDFRPLPDLAALPPVLAALLAWWERKREEEARLPRREDVNPAEIPRLLPHIALLDILRDPLDYRYRLIGTRLVETMGGERTGKRMREVMDPPAIEGTVMLMTRLIETREPVAFTGRLFWLRKEYLGFHALVLPLSSTGEEIDMAVMGVELGQPEE